VISQAGEAGQQGACGRAGDAGRSVALAAATAWGAEQADFLARRLQQGHVRFGASTRPCLDVPER
jgi:hypothetical protein